MNALRLLLLSVVLSFALTGAGTSSAQAQPAVPAADQAAINATVQAFGDTVTAMDFNKFATLWTDDADFVNIVGMHWHGKAEIVKGHTAVFTTRFRHVVQHQIDATTALLRPDVALVVQKIQMDPYTAQDGSRVVDSQYRMTLVLEKHDGRWLIRAGENTVLDPEAAKHDPVHPA